MICNDFPFCVFPRILPRKFLPSALKVVDTLYMEEKGFVVSVLPKISAHCCRPTFCGL
jgi:hypothetical protein